METKPPGRSASREIVERAVEAGLGAVPLVGNALAITFVTAISWRLNDRREEWFTQLAQGVEELRKRLDGVDVESLTSDDRFVDAVVSAARTVDHTHQEEKLDALRNAVLNSVAPDAPDSDTQAIFLSLIDRWTSSHLRLLALWDNPAEWFTRHGLTPPQAGMAGSRTQTVEAGLPEMRGRKEFYMLVAGDLRTAGMMNADLAGMVSVPSLMSRLTTDFGRQLVRFISAPGQ